jgi:hypothetical protein
MEWLSVYRNRKASSYRYAIAAFYAAKVIIFFEYRHVFDCKSETLHLKLKFSIFGEHK